MTEFKLHIVSFDVPWPDDYGGVIDVFHKVRHLHASGASIHLHCFTYGRQAADILNKYCTRVSYYPRNISKLLLFQPTPYIVSSRVSEPMLKEIQRDDAPVLLEGLHCTAQAASMGFHKRKIMVRAHNVEHDYYRLLAQTEKHLFKKIYLEQEAAKLEKYEPLLLRQLPVAAISRADHEYFEKRYGQSTFIPAFHANDSVSIPEGRGEYFLYHGNIGVSENRSAAEWLLENVLPGLRHPLYIAGNRIPSSLIRKYEGMNVRFISSPGHPEMDSLIRGAQVLLLPATQSTGIKLKLIESLFKGRHLLINSTMSNDPVIRSLCNTADDPKAFIQQANDLFDSDFDISDIRNREEILLEHFSNRTAAAALVKALQAS